MGLTYSSPSPMLVTTYIPESDEHEENNRSSNEVTDSDSESNGESSTNIKSNKTSSDTNNVNIRGKNKSSISDDYDHGKAL